MRKDTIKHVVRHDVFATINAPITPINFVADLTVIVPSICAILGVYFAIRKEMRENAEQREERDKELMAQIEKSISGMRNDFRRSLEEIKRNQSSGAHKLEAIDRNVVQLAVRFESHEKLPGHSGSIQGIEDIRQEIKQMVRNLGGK